LKKENILHMVQEKLISVLRVGPLLPWLFQIQEQPGKAKLSVHLFHLSSTSKAGGDSVCCEHLFLLDTGN
jgi:hypothetical protein